MHEGLGGGTCRYERYAHPGGAQAHGDMVAIAMEKPHDPIQGAAVYFAWYKADVGDG